MKKGEKKKIKQLESTVLNSDSRPLSEITLSGNPYNFHILFLNNLVNPSAIIFSVIVIKYNIFENLLHTTKIES